jgi:hypothetical protein
MFRKGLKKRQRYAALRRLLSPLPAEERCLLLTCGDNSGAMNYYLRELGGRWSWADLEETSIKDMAARTRHSTGSWRSMFMSTSTIRA